MEASCHRHDISDNVRTLLEPHLPGRRGQWGGIAQDNRRFINAVFWVLRTGAPWRGLPPDYGKWGSVHQRFIRWRRKGVWEKLLEILIDEPDYEWLVIPPKKNRKEQRGYDKYLYKLRHLAENCFLSLKRWRGIATRYAKTSDAFVAAIHVRCIAIWAAIRA